MAEVQQYVFTYPEIAEALVKKQEIHEGLWGVFIEFGLEAANIRPPEGSEGTFFPAAIVPVRKIGIQRFHDHNYLTVDAAIVNPVDVQSHESRSVAREQRGGRQKKNV